MKVSIVIPAYNEEKIIGQTIKAALAQNYEDYEVIVVNNASTDRTAEIVSQFPEVKLVNESKKGLLWAREAGRKAATGELIANLDADCLPDPTWLRNAVWYFMRNDNIVGVTGPCNYYDGPIYLRVSAILVQTIIYKLVSEFLQLPFVRGGSILNGGNNVLRADILEKMGGYNTNLLFYGEDTNTAKRIAKYGRVTFDITLFMKTSARRYMREGSLNLFVKYLYHFFKQIFWPTAAKSASK